MGYWFDGEELDKVVEITAKKRWCLKRRDTAAEDEVLQAVVKFREDLARRELMNRRPGGDAIRAVARRTRWPPRPRDSPHS